MMSELLRQGYKIELEMTPFDGKILVGLVRFGVRVCCRLSPEDFNKYGEDALKQLRDKFVAMGVDGPGIMVPKGVKRI